MKQITARQWEVYENRRRRGWSVSNAAKEARVSYSSANKRENRRAEGLEDPGSISSERRRWQVFTTDAPGPMAVHEMRPEAQRALEDFSFFQRRYFGRIATPWQAEAANEILRYLHTPEKEFVVINAPPGAGKSTAFTLDIPAWLTCRNRRIRGLIGSKTAQAATRYVQRLKRHFEMTSPWQNEADLVELGLALDAEATLADDFGLFRPTAKDLWGADSFVVAQLDGRLIAEKEPTWSAYGMDSGFLGMRYDFIIWDDLVETKVMRTSESRENQQDWWDKVAEKRLDPAGLLVLQGQRMGPDDLYRYCLDKRLLTEEEEAEEEGEIPRKYHHVVFKAHYPDRCTEEHSTGAAYWPDGCLLDPRRLPWKELRAEMSNPRNNFEVLYQQEDVDPGSVLIDPAWIYGGTDLVTGELFPGCVDAQRGIAEVPSGLDGQLLSIATCDPSTARWWSIQWYVVRCVAGVPQERYLMDHYHQRMDAPGFLDWNQAAHAFTGLAEEWQVRSEKLGCPIAYWIVEANAAQRYMLQFEHMRRWLAFRRTSLIPHQTYSNKTDPEFGIETLKSVYRYGLVRLPMKSGAPYIASIRLIDEVTHWPQWKTDDCVMAQWFLEWHLPRLVPSGTPLPRAGRPSWLRGTNTWGWRNKAKELTRAG